MAQVIENPQFQQFPMMLEIANRAIEAKTTSIKRFLEASEIDNADDFVLQMKESRFDDSNAIGEFQQFLTERLGQGGAQGAAAGGAGAVPEQPMAGGLSVPGPTQDAAAGGAGSGFQL